MENIAYNHSEVQEEANYEDYEDYEFFNGKQHGKIDYEAKLSRFKEIDRIKSVHLELYQNLIDSNI